MQYNARELTRTIMKSVDSYEKYEIWRFLNCVLIGTRSQAQLDSEHVALLTTILQETVCGMHDEALEDTQRSSQWALQIATWINSVDATSK